MEWTADGKHIVFGGGGTINVADAEGTQLRTVVTMSHGPRYGVHANVSPDGSRIVYSTCEYETESLPAARYDNYDRAEKRHYEIASIGIDGSSPKRLTENEYFDHYPVWSPDGTRIAYVASPDDYIVYDPPHRAQLFTMAADGSDVSALSALPAGVALYPPAWSPDGRWLAFISNEDEFHPFSKVLHAVRADGSGLSKIGETVELPAWAPDSRRLAFVAGEGSESVVYTVNPDGTGLVEVLRGMGGPVTWSPDGSEVLVSHTADPIPSWHRPGLPRSGGIYAVRPDGGGVRRQTPYLFSALSAWSPDGSRVAFYAISGQIGGQIVTTAPDGTDLRGVVNHGLVPWNLSRPARAVDIGACPGGLVVADPEANPGLVEDCQVLLGLREDLAGSAELGWYDHTPIERWEGVFLGGSPPRVHSLGLDGAGVTGRLSPELGKLTALRSLSIYGSNDPSSNRLTRSHTAGTGKSQAA